MGEAKKPEYRLRDLKKKLKDILVAEGYSWEDGQGYDERDNLAIEIWIEWPSSSMWPIMLDIEVSVRVLNGPGHARVYFPLSQHAHGDVRYQPKDKGFPQVAFDDFKRLLLPLVNSWRNVEDVVEGLLRQQLPPDRGRPVANHATAALRLIDAAGLGDDLRVRALKMIEEREWPDDIADHLEWFADKSNQPLVIRRQPPSMWKRLFGRR